MDRPLGFGEPKDFITKEKYPSNNMCIRIAHKKETKMSKHAKNVLSYLRVCNKKNQTQNIILTTNVSCQTLNLKVSNERTCCFEYFLSEHNGSKIFFKFF